MSEIPRNTPAARILPVTQWSRHHDWPTLPGLRWMIFNRERNGLAASGALRRVGRRVLIEEAAFFRWVRGQAANEGQAAPVGGSQAA